MRWKDCGRADQRNAVSSPILYSAHSFGWTCPDQGVRLNLKEKRKVAGYLRAVLLIKFRSLDFVHPIALSDHYITIGNRHAEMTYVPNIIDDFLPVPLLLMLNR
jgi:hypothetical protein